MGHLVKDLDLSDDQRTRLEAARLEAGLTRPERGERGEGSEMRGRRSERLEAMLAAFERDDFDAARLGIGERLGPGKHRRGERMAKELEVLLPILTEAQRGALADRMELRFEHGHHGAGLPAEPDLPTDTVPDVAR